MVATQAALTGINETLNTTPARARDYLAELTALTAKLRKSSNSTIFVSVGTMKVDIGEVFVTGTELGLRRTPGSYKLREMVDFLMRKVRQLPETPAIMRLLRKLELANFPMNDADAAKFEEMESAILAKEAQDKIDAAKATERRLAKQRDAEAKAAENHRNRAAEIKAKLANPFYGAARCLTPKAEPADQGGKKGKKR